MSYTITACLRDTMGLVERSLKGLMQGSLRNYDGENCVSMGLCRIVSELVNYSFFPLLVKSPPIIS